jgi:tetratricopeptide (TPR) repeat protein
LTIYLVMRHSIILLFCFFSLISYSQTIKEKYDEFFLLLQKTDYPNAIKTGEELLPLLQRDSVFADVSFYLANSYAAQQDFTNAIRISEEEKTVRAKINGRTHGYYLNAVYYLAYYYSLVENYEAAVPLYLEVYAEMKKQYPGTANTIALANSLAETCNASGMIRTAQDLYEDSWEWIRSSYPPTDSVYINMTYTIADFYVTYGMMEKAVPFYKMERDRQEKVYTKKSDQYMNACNNLGELYIYAGMYNDAEKIYTEFVSLAESFYGKKSADYATSLNNLAVAYEKQNRFTEAEKLYLKSLEIKEKVYTKNSDFYALTLVNIGVVYDYMGNNEKAEKYLTEALLIYETYYKNDNSNYATALNNIASIYVSSGKSEKAVEVLNKSIEINKKIWGEDSKGYLTSLNSLGSVYQTMGDLDKAEKIFTEALPLFEKILGKNHTDLGVVLFNLANVKIARGKYLEAIQLLDQDLLIQETAVGKIHDKYVTALQTQASVYGLLGQTRKAEDLYLESGEIYTQLYGKMHPEYAAYLNNYGLFLFNKGDYQNAEEKLNDAWGIQANAFGENHPDNIALLGNIANIQVEKNNFKDAEENLLQALEIAKTNFKPEQPDYSTTLNNVATLYYHLANYDKAEYYYKEALELRKKYYGEKHTEYAVSLNNMGTLYLSKASSTSKPEEMKEWSSKAISYFKQSLAVDSIAIGFENPEIASHLNNLAEAYRLRNEPEPAEKLFKQCIELEEKYWGEGNVKTALSYHNLALVYAGLKQFDKAEETALKSISIFEKNYGKNSSSASGVTASLAFIYESTEKNEKAKENYLAALKTQRDLLEQNFSFLSESEKESYVNSVSLYNDMFNTFASKNKISDPSITGLVYSNEIYNKGLLFRSSTRVKDIILESKNKELISNYTQWMDTRQELSVLYSTPEINRKKNVREVEEKANELEKQLVVQSENIKNELKSSKAEWEDVKAKLKTGQSAIEFIHYTRNDEYKDDLYAALVITPNSKSPEMIELFTDEQLTKIIGTNSGTTYESVSKLYGINKNLNVDLFSLVWGPLEKSLTGITEIYYSPTGLLHKISFASIGDANGKFVSDKYILHQLNSTASILDLVDAKLEPKQSLIAMIGGVKYDTDNSTQHVWSYLPGTLTETEHIQSSLLKVGMKTEIFTAELASEENLKKMDGEKSPDILHVATHGFFFGDPNVQKEKIEKQVTSVKFRGESRGVNTLVENPNPLMRSGIVLAGANDVWNETKPGIKNEKEDGILTAYEVSLMNLQNTKLIVLSACETGLGDIKGAEGVYGLQRAFRIAGADMMIMSLWQVPDKETDEFMTAFYNELIKTKEIRKAFVNAQKLMRTKYDPYFWGAFVLIE